MADYFRARSTFVTNTGNGVRTVRKDTLVTADDPVYKIAPRNFQAVSDAVEQATAGPGEKRTLSSPHLIREAAKKATSSGRRGGKKADEKSADEKPADDGAKDEQPVQPEQDQGDGDNTPPADEATDGASAAQ